MSELFSGAGEGAGSRTGGPAPHPDRLIAWLDGEVAEAEAALIAGHVDGCPQCQDQLADFRDVGRYIQMISQTNAPRPPRALPRIIAALSMPVAAALALLFIAHRPAPPVALDEVPQNFVRISIPAEAVLPPGAIPDGVEFVADVPINTLP